MFSSLRIDNLGKDSQRPWRQCCDLHVSSPDTDARKPKDLWMNCHDLRMLVHKHPRVPSSGDPETARDRLDPKQSGSQTCKKDLQTIEAKRDNVQLED
nr:hypothetical protein BgiMline_010920 [Biomphalaria glabrata]